MDTKSPLLLPKELSTHAYLQADQVFNLLDVSEASRKDYKYRIPLFIEFVQKYGMKYDTYLEFKRYLANRTDLTVATKNKYLATAKIFVKELNRQGILPTDITQNTKMFSQSKKHKREGLNEKEISLLTQHIRSLENTPKNARKKALFCLLALQGLRQIEIIRLNVKDVDLVNKIAFVQGKGRDDKELVHIHPETVKTLKEYMKANKIADGALFKSLGNRKSERITTMTIKREVKGMLAPLGIEKTVHGFRHYYITTLLKKLDVRDVRKFSRHSSLEMLIVYDDEIDIAHKAIEVFQAFNGITVTT
jgi:integrase